MKIHLPLPTMLEEAEELKLKAPIESRQELRRGIQKLIGEDMMSKVKNIDPLIVRDSTINKEKKYYMAPFHKDKIERYDNRKPEDLFTKNDWKFVAQKLCFYAGLRTLLSDGKGLILCAFQNHLQDPRSDEP